MVNPERQPQSLTCAAVETNLVAYLKDGLNSGLEAAVRAHLLQCPACADLVQEARELDAALYAAAPRRPDRLPSGLSAQFQEDVYRRMRRALVFQRTRAFTGRVVTVLVTFLFVVGLGLMVGPWLRYLATVDATPTPPAVASQGLAVLPSPTPAVLPPTAAALQVVPTATLPVEYHSPADSVRALLEAAIAGNDDRVQRLLVGTRTRARRVRARLEPCRGALDAGRLHYSTVRYETNVAGVRIRYDNRRVGEVKLLLREDGYWYLHYLHYDSLDSILGDGCLALP